MMRRWGWAAVALAAGWGGPAAWGRYGGDPFDHPEHARLFPDCESCHLGAASPSASLWPTTAGCEACHDGEVEPRVTWAPPEVPRASNLRFGHGEHATVMEEAAAAPATCIDCHAETGAPWMTVQIAAIPRCLTCHEIATPHLEAPDAACAACHQPLAAATRLGRERVAVFPAPPSHDIEGFAAAEHGRQARPITGAGGIAASCGTCHARDYCALCHVDAPEQPTVQALAPDDRSLVHRADLRAPTDHEESAFTRTHGGPGPDGMVACRTCHTRESCYTCHIATPAVANKLYAAGPNRGRGAVVEREVPDSHDGGFVDAHGSAAAANPTGCAGCHAREDCLDCHRPGAASAPAYHDADVLTRHPVLAYRRETTCADCHETRAFCVSCHAVAGLAGGTGSSGGFHDAKGAFAVGHGVAARQALESCVSCHAERDCLTCHSAAGGRGFSPHGPDFDAVRMARKNAEMCLACHRTTPAGSP